MELAGRAVLITGGKRIGAAVAEDLAGRGMDVAVTFNRSVEEANEVAEAVRRHGRRAVTIQADLSDADGVRGDSQPSGGRVRTP